MAGPSARRTPKVEPTSPTGHKVCLIMLACQKSVPIAHKLRFHLRIYICIAVHLYYTGVSDSKNATVHENSRHSRRSTPDSEPLNYLRRVALHRGRSVAASFSPVFCPCLPVRIYIYVTFGTQIVTIAFPMRGPSSKFYIYIRIYIYRDFPDL